MKGVAGEMSDKRLNGRLLGMLLWLLAGLVMSAAAYDLPVEITNALSRHDTTAVLGQIDAAIKIDPTYAPYFLIKGQIYYARGKYPEALAQFEEAVKKKPKLDEAAYYQGLVLLEQGKLTEAEKIFDEGIKKAKEQKARFHNGMGLLLIKRQEYAKADVEFRKAIQVGPDQAEFHANLGDANYYAKIYPLAISEYNSVIGMDTTFLDVYFRLARAYVAQNQYNEAVDQLRIVLTRDSLYTNAWQEIGKLYTLAGLSARDAETKEQRFKEAIGSYRRYLELSRDSADGEVFFNLGRAYFNLGGYPQADTAFQRVLSLGNTPANINLYLGRTKIGEEKYTEGIELLQRHLEQLRAKDPGYVFTGEDADIFRRMADGYKAMQDYANAADNYAKAFALDSTNPRVAVDAALAFHQLKNYPEALKYYEKRIALGPDAWNMFLNAAYCTLALEDYPKSAEYLKRVIALDSMNVKALTLLSNTYLYQMQNCDEGIAWTKKLLEIDSTNCDAIKGLGFAYFSDNICQPDYLKAISYFTRALSCYRAAGSDNCSHSDLLLFIAQADQMYGIKMDEVGNKPEKKKYMKEAFDGYKLVLKCDPGNASAQKGKKDTEFEF